MVPWLVVMVPLYVQFGLIYVPSNPRRLYLAVALAVAAIALKFGKLGAVVAAVGGVAILAREFPLEDAVRVWALGFGALMLVSYATRAAAMPFRRIDPRLLRPGLALLVPAAWMLLRQRGLDRPSVFVANAWILSLIPLTFARDTLAVLDRLKRRMSPLQDRLESAGAFLGRILAAVAMIPPGVVVVAAWLFQRVLRLDPLASRTASDSAWAPRSGADPRPQQLFSSATFTGRIPAGQRIRSVAVGTLAVLAIGVPVTLRSLDAAGVEAPSNPLAGEPECLGPGLFDAVMHDDPGWPLIACEFDEYSAEGRFDAVTTYSMADYDGEYINVLDGARKTWRAPECDCPRISIWFFGGSAAFGWWQRDEFSPPSELAKAAWEAGIALDITTYAAPGWVLGQEVREFGERLVNQDAPDMALFYDGGNDLNRQYARNIEGRGADESQTSFTEEEINLLLSEGPLPWNQPREPADNIERGPEVSPTELADHAMNRYLRDVDLATLLAASADVETVFIWQPLLGSAPESVIDPNAMPPEDVAEWRIIIEAALERLPPDAIDLSDSLDDADRLVFKDLFHTNEYASKVIGEDLFDALRPRLEPVD